MTEQFEIDDLASVLAAVRMMTNDPEKNELLAHLALGLAVVSELNRTACLTNQYRPDPAPTAVALLRRAARMPGDPHRAAEFLIRARAGLRADDGRDFATKSALEYLGVATTLMLSALVDGISGYAQRPLAESVSLLGLRVASEAEH